MASRWCPSSSARHSYRLLARGGTLVSYGQAAQLAQLAAWNHLPTGRRASFCNVWGGHRANPARFWARLPLTEATAAMELAESHTVVGKVILEP